MDTSKNLPANNQKTFVTGLGHQLSASNRNPEYSNIQAKYRELITNSSSGNIRLPDENYITQE
jgi:hypothetical protein